MLAPYRATTVGATLINGHALTNNPIQFTTGETLNTRIETAMNGVYDEVKATAKEFNARGDLHSATNIAAFLRVANIMLSHGSV
jgi:glutamate dehydrogenase (NADP+)